jgi:hypothetical protein
MIRQVQTKTKDTNTMARPRKNISLNYDNILNALRKGETLKLKVLAVEHGTCPPVIKRYLSEHFGDRIVFVPGRNGGVRLNAVERSQISWAAHAASQSPEMAEVA